MDLKKERFALRECGALVICFLSIPLLVLLCDSGAWSKHVVTAQPKTIFNVYRSILSIVPDANGNFRPAPVASKEWESETPEPLFAVWGGLWQVSIPSICDPMGETFDAVVDRNLCKVKLEAFCRSMMKATPDSDISFLTDLYNNNCMNSAGGEGGVFIPLLLGPVVEEARKKTSIPMATPAELGSADDTVEMLEQELGTTSTDTDPNFCETVANCRLLEKIRPSSIGLFVVFVLANSAILISCCMHCVAWKRHSKLLSIVGWHTYLVAIILALTLVIMYIVSSGDVSADMLVKKEELFYFMLPSTFEPPMNKEDKVQADGASQSLMQLGEEPPARRRTWSSVGGGYGRTGRRWGEQPGGRGGEQLRSQRLAEARQLLGAPGPRLVGGASSYLALQQRQRAEWWWSPAPKPAPPPPAPKPQAVGAASKSVPRISPRKWEGAILGIIGELVEAIQTGNWDKFFDNLKLALEEAFRISQIIFKRWVYYVEKALERGPQDGNALLDALLEGVLEMKKVEAACEAVGATCNMTEHSALRAEAAAELEEVHKLSLIQSKAIIDLVKTVQAVIVGVVDIWNTVSEPVFRMIERVKNFLSQITSLGEEKAKANNDHLDKYFQDDLNVLFVTLFSQMPYVMANVRTVGRQWMALIKNMDTYLARLARAMRIVHRLVVELLKVAASESLAASQQLLMDLRIDTLSKAASFWTTLLMDAAGGDNHLFELKRELELAVAGDTSIGVSTAAPTVVVPTIPTMPPASNESSASSFASLDAEGSGMAMSLMERLQSGSLVRSFNAQGGLASQIAPFISGGLSNPAARLGSIFLDELSTMSTKTGFKTRAQLGKCSMTSLSLCTQYSYGFWLYWLVLILMIAAYVCFTFEFWRFHIKKLIDELSEAPPAPHIQQGGGELQEAVPPQQGHQPEADVPQAGPQGAMPQAWPQGAAPQTWPQGAQPQAWPQGAAPQAGPQGAQPQAGPQGAAPQAAPQGGAPTPQQ